MQAVMDAMTGVFWRDDALVCKGTTVKEYSDRPRTEIRVKKL
jgi:Holliday junction resolvase RusA-like endonuclease